jgi:GT2 family glycosyltransferase
MASTPSARVAACIVTHDSAADVAACLGALAAQEHAPLEVVLVDCASRDGTVDAARAAVPAFEAAGIALRLIPLAENRGFAGGMNAALAAGDAPYVLTLNADALPAPDYVARLLERMEAHPEHRVGAATGRLLRPALTGASGASGASGALVAPRRLDACGMRLTPAWRHLDRGSGEVDRGQWTRAERVFGCTGAASLFRRAALADAAVEGAVFDADFHSFREDAELCLRLRERGWEVLYEPRAVCEHRRFNLPERRRRMPAAINYHSLKNRYLLRAYHQTARNFVITALPALGRDLLALTWVLLRERSSLAAYAWLWRNRRAIARRRRLIQARRLVPAAAIDRWFWRRGLPL